MLTKNEIEKIQQLCKESAQAREVYRLMEQESRRTLSMISHEIRNPVTLINSFLQLFSGAHPTVSSWPYWNDIIDNMSFLRSLLEELSQYNNASVLHKEALRLDHFLSELSAEAAPALACQGITLTLCNEGSVPPFPADRGKLRQVFLNLIRNAAEAIGDAGGEINILLTADPEQIRILVTDNGPGIAPEHLDTLFDFFVTHKKEGTGLGLAICRQCIEAHGGSINAASRAEGGAVFTITLPLRYKAD